MAAAVQVEKIDRPELAKHDSSILDLVFIMDCTASMGTYIDSAKNNVRSIVEEIVVSEKSDVRLALVEYRDHPPQDHTFVTRVHDFTAKISEMKTWLDDCSSGGGGDVPEAVADGLHAALKLSWRDEATKICVLISDAPPHGLGASGDGFPNGCPDGLDPVKIVREMTKKRITLYVIGVEPPIVVYRDFFMSLAYITGGQYVPMINANLLAQVIIGGVREEITLDRLMQDAQADIDREMQRAEVEGVDEKEKIKRINNIFSSKNIRSQQMTNVFGGFSTVTTECYSKCADMNEMKVKFSSALPPASTSGFTFGAAPTSTAPTTGGFFGAAPTSGSTSLFGSSTSTAPFASSAFTAPTSGFTFGAAPTSSSTSLFSSSTSTAPTTGGLFGTAPTSGSTSLFGSSTSTAPFASSEFTAPTSGFTFGAAPTSSSTSLFSSSTPTAPTTGGLFDAAPTSNSTSFYGSSTSEAATNSFTFGAAPISNTTSTFGSSTSTAPTSGFTFGTTITEPTYELAEKDFSENQASRVYQKWQNRKK